MKKGTDTNERNRVNTWVQDEWVMMSRGGESIEVEEKREITATTATTRMDEELDEERRDVNDENEDNTPLSVNDFDFERWLEHDESKQKRKRTKKENEKKETMKK